MLQVRKLAQIICAFVPIGFAVPLLAQTANTKTTYTYDALDRITQVTDPSGFNTTYQYDGLSDPTSSTSPDSGTKASTYDTAGNVLTAVDAKGNTVTYTYDASNRRLTGTYADPTQNVTYVYDQPNGVTGCSVSYPIGHLTQVVENSVTTTLCYNAQGFVIQKSQAINGQTQVTSYTRSPAGRLLAITHPSGDQVNYARDANGRISGVSVTTNNGTATVVSNVTYAPFGPVTGYTLGNGQSVTRTYDANYRLTDLVSPAFALHVARDAMGNVTAMGTAPGANPATESYGYDPLNRLTTVTEADGSIFESETYNQAGDRLTKAGNGLATGTYAYNPGTHQLISTGNAARTVDANGNTTAISGAGSTYGFGFNQRNRMSVVQLNQSTIANYLYDAAGERVEKTVGGATTTFNYDVGSHLVGEYGATNREYVYMDDIPVANIDINGSTTSIAYVTADHTGTPRAITDGSGNVLWAWTYEGNPWGELAPITTGYTYNLRFPGQYFDVESGLTHNFQRDFDSSTGRFTQTDPSGQAGGLPLYVYGANNPLRNVDPYGLWVCNGTTSQCGSFQGGLQALAAASTSSNLDPAQQATLANILAAYGQQGDPSVQIYFQGDKTSSVGGWTGKDKKYCESVTFNDDNLNLGMSDNQKLQQWAKTVTHEGQHVADDFEGAADGYPLALMDTEVNAYTAEAYYQQAAQYSEGSTDIWTMSGGINWNAIQTSAANSVRVETGH
ncbi:RHS repeat-associated core domain-containing protein [Dyella humi]|uniref:Teneurin-like YD-shell domain-containing protein n=1 Tax=Dyella humi TaxID=1770547 RepID=A0ABW8IJJ6_9GAMM